MSVVGVEFDTRLARALQEGCDILPDDPERLSGYLRMIQRMLSDRATEREPEWDHVMESASEIDNLHRLEDLVVEKAISLRSNALDEILAKLRIWRAIGEGGVEGEDEDGRATPRDRLVLSVEADLTRVARARAV